MEITDYSDLEQGISDLHTSIGEMYKELRERKKDGYHSSELNELFSALSKAQAEMAIAGLNSDNPFFKSKYADMAILVKASRPALVKNGLCVIQQIVPKDGNKNALRTTLGHSSGQWIASRVVIAPIKPDIQSMGSYITYLKRYCYAALVGIVTGDEDDDGEQAMQRSTPRHIDKINIISGEELSTLKIALGEYTGDLREFLSGMGIHSLIDLPKEKYHACLTRLNEIKKTQK